MNSLSCLQNCPMKSIGKYSKYFYWPQKTPPNQIARNENKCHRNISTREYCLVYIGLNLNFAILNN